MKTRVTCIKCPSCKDVVYSRAKHDCNYCSCGEVAIDGGFSGYCRIIFKDKPPKQFIKYVNASKNQLYEDWNIRKNKYGKIKQKVK